VSFPLLLITDLARLTARAPVLAKQRVISMTPFYVDPEASTTRFFVVEWRFANRTVVVETCSVLPLEQIGGHLVRVTSSTIDRWSWFEGLNL
jgi:hypothetical protein